MHFLTLRKERYQLCQWKETDKVLRTEFNADNAKIDAAIKAYDDPVPRVLVTP